MEYVKSNGSTVIVEGNKIQDATGKIRENIIGVNFANGAIHGGYLSSFNESFDDELIGIESGMGDIVNSKLGDIKDAYELLKTKISGIDSSNIFELSRAVLETVNEYFNGFDNISKRMSYYYDEDYEESKNNKISDLKGTGAAMCVERAALSQNLLKSLGINSFYKASGIIKNGNREAHSYNLVEFNGKYYIFDATMPNLIDGKPNPLITEIDKDTFDSLSAPIYDIGISVTTSHYNPYRDMNITVTYDSGREKQIEVNPLGNTNNDEINSVIEDVDSKETISTNSKKSGSISMSAIVLLLLATTIFVLVVKTLNVILK